MNRLVLILSWLIAPWGVVSYAQNLDINDITDEVDYGYLDTCRVSDDIEVVVIHSNYHVGTDPFSTHGCIAQFREYDVAPHYLIERNGAIIRMVDESRVAYHAGPSHIPSDQGRYSSINRHSIGIELINTRTAGPTKEQFASLVKLVRNICYRNDIKYIVRHKDIAPRRKSDPWLLDWKRLALEVGTTFPYVIFSGN